MSVLAITTQPFFQAQPNATFSVGNSDSNTFYGYQCGIAAVAGTAKFNTGFGHQALQSLTTGLGNTALGYLNFQLTTTGSYNTTSGPNSFVNVTPAASNNTGLGQKSGFGINGTGGPGSGNTLLGINAGQNLNNSSAVNNTFVGFGASSATGVNTPNNSTALGAVSSTVNFTNATAIGTGATSTANHQIMLGQSTNFVVCAGTSTTNGALQTSSSIQNNSASTVSGAATFTQPQLGSAWKRVLAYCNNLTGAQSYTFPVAFTHTPQIVATNGPAAGVVTSLSTTSVTITGSSTTGFVILEGY